MFQHNHTPNILIVDDLEESRMTMKALLAAENYTLHFARNGREALTQTRSLLPDLIVLDVMMPDMTGFEVCKRIREDERVAQIPIFLVTALDDRDSVAMGMNAGADDFITKPFDRFLLRARIKNIVKLNRFRRLHAEQNKFSQLTQLSPDGVLLLDDCATIQFANHAAGKLFGQVPEALVGSLFWDFLDSEQADSFGIDIVAQLTQGAQPETKEYALRTSKDECLWVEIAMSGYQWDDQSFLQLLVRNISRRKQSEEELHLYSHRQSVLSFLGQRALELNQPELFFDEFLTVLNNTLKTHASVILKATHDDSSDSHVELLAVTPKRMAPNAKFSSNIEYEVGYALRQSSPVHVADTRHQHCFSISPAVAELRSKSLLLQSIGQGSQRWGVLLTVHQKANGLNEEDVKFVQAASAVASSFIHRQQMQLQLMHELSHDTVTGLPNRGSFERTADQHLSTLYQRNEMSAVLTLQVNNFQELNSALGHRISDLLLCAIASCVKEHCPSEWQLGYLGGSQFGAFIPDTPNEESVIADIEPLIQRLQTPLEVEELPIQLYVTCGISIAPLHAHNALGLLRLSGKASRRARQLGTWCHIYEPNTANQDTIQLTLAADIQKGIQEEQFFLEFQPKLDLTTGKMVGAEALVRWKHPKRGRLSPALFIDVAEKTAQIRTLSKLVLEQAIRTANQLFPTDSELRMSINLSPLTLCDPTLFDEIQQTLETHQCQPEKLTCEITETAIMTQFDLVACTLSKLRNLGVHISIDDFGTGYSSLNYLSKLPIDEIKLDRSFIQELNESKTATIVQSVIKMATALGFELVAEGIEDNESSNLLQKMGCKNGQGYYFSKPLPYKEFATYIQQHFEQSEPPV